MSSFRGTPFDWEFSNPKRTIQDGALHLSGSVIIYAQSDLDSLFGFVRPCTVRLAGDPMAGGLIYVDHWGPDPSGSLNMTYLPGDTADSNPVTYRAILTSLNRNEALPRGVHKAEADFLILVDLLTYVPGQTGSPRTGQTGGQAGYDPATVDQPATGSGQRIDAVARSDSSDTVAWSLWDGVDSNVMPPDQWEQDYFDSGDWGNAVQASGGSAVPASSPVWSTEDPRGDGEEVLFRQLFSAPTDGEIIGAILDLQFNEHLTGIWVNGDTIAGSLGTSQPMPVDPSSLRPGEQNVIAISAVARGGEPAYVSFRLDVWVQVAPPAPPPSEPPP